MPAAPTRLATGRRILERHGPLLAVLVAVAALAAALHRDGLGWGDDYTLYLRQAKSLVDGNVGQVIADNHFNVANAAKPGFSPYVYPWGWPILLAPFLRWWGLDAAKLKLVEVACLCGFLAVFHAVVRRRTGEGAGRWVALGVVATIGTTLAYLQHTDELLSEFPYLFAVALTLWWLDRCRRNGNGPLDVPLAVPLDQAGRNRLIVLGLLAMAVFNIRREGLAMIVAIAATHLVESRGRWRRLDWRAVATPYVSFIVGVVALQAMLPSALAPEYAGSGLHQTWSKLRGSFKVAFGEQLGFDHLHGIGLVVVLALVVGGIVLRLSTHAADDIGLVVFAIVSMTIVGMIPAVADRYLLAVTPFAVYFGAQAIAAVRLPHHAGRWAAVGALGALTVLHVTKLPDPIRAIQHANESGTVQDGPLSAYAQAGFDAVRHHTHESDVVAFFKARSMTYFTGRRAVQSSDLQLLRERSDFFLARRNSGFSQPLVNEAEATAMGWVSVWSDAEWQLWRLPRLDAATP
ncbi:MAG: hypothetical protein ABIR68_06015 [Ilumatobacteraceae bacterium]